MMKYLFLAFTLMPNIAMAQIIIPNVKVKGPPSQLERAVNDPTNWILGGIFIAVILIGVLLLRKKDQ